MSSIGNMIGKVVGGITGTTQATNAAVSASKTQSKYAQSAIDEENNMYNSIISLMSPYISAGTSALTQQQNLSGANGNDAQQTAINNIKNSSAYTTALSTGENSILQNASATGGLRGGNTQAALEQYAPTLLNQMVQQQYSNLSGLSSQGLSATNSQANYGSSTASSIANLLTGQGSAVAGGQIASGSSTSSAISSLAKLLGTASGF